MPWFVDLAITMRYNKLIRDRISEYVRKKGGVPVTHVVNDAEY